MATVVAQLAALGCGGGGEKTVAPPVITVSAVEVTPSAAALEAGQTLQLTAVAKDGSGASVSRTFTWQSSDASKATVNSSGLVTGVAEVGAVSISATTDGKTGVATLQIKPPGVSSVSVALGASQLTPGQTTQATATLRDVTGVTLAGRAIAWSVTNAAVASVSTSGVVTAIAAGQIQITATSEGKSASATLTVTPPPVSTVTLEPATAYLYVGESGGYTVTLKDAAGNALTNRTVTWTSSAPTVATVSATGIASGVAPGTTTITATSEGQSATAALTVLVPPAAVASITLAPSPASLSLGDAGYFTVTLRDASGNVLTGRPITWTSSVPSVATVAADGLVSGIALGSTLITATSEGKSTSASVTIVPRPGAVAPVASVTLQPSAVSLYVGAAGYFGVVLKDASGNVLTNRVITWTSSAPTIASVGSDGLVTALAPGSALITATSEGTQGLRDHHRRDRPGREPLGVQPNRRWPGHCD
ncbi:MAG: Ig-like domain-containing protein [Gemmatimonadetes bacterium]|nr:Ig-like domain-containing protein [Gemmatimonadota bacterium]